MIEYGRRVGGGSVHFTANYWRLWESDFKQKSKWGGVAGTSLADWPITYADLEPYYTKAEEELEQLREALGIPRLEELKLFGLANQHIRIPLARQSSKSGGGAVTR